MTAGKWSGYAVTERSGKGYERTPNGVHITLPDGTPGQALKEHLVPTKGKDRIEVYPSKKVKGQFGWRYKAKNGKKVATSGELYKKRSHALDMVHRLFGYRVSTGAAYIEVVKK